MTVEEIKELGFEDLETRAAAIAEEVKTADKDQIEALNAELDAIEERRGELTAEVEKRRADVLAVAEGAGTAIQKERLEDNTDMKCETRAKEFVESGHMVMETRQLLSTGNIAKPANVGGISGLGVVAAGIVDDVKAIALSGTGSWIAAYKKTEAAAADVTDGNNVGGTASTYDYVTITPSEWGVLDEISKQVAKLTPLDYTNAIEDAAVIALRAKASSMILAALASSSLVEAKSYTLDVDFLRNLVLGFKTIEGKGARKLYLSNTDLATLGAVRGANEKRALYEIEFDDETCTGGTIKEGGMATAFRVLDGLTAGTMYYGQPGAIDMPMWGDYTVETDESGDYFKRNMIGIRGLQTAGAGLVAKYGMQKITATAAGESES